MRAIVRRANGASNTGWRNIDDSANWVEMAWASGASTQFQLTVNGAAPVNLNGLLTSAYTVNTLRLGPQNTANNSTNAGATIYLDEVVVTSSTTIGPN
ncbi:hypothetical protein K2Z83_16330 [Oscillochloris sp. ZM17-4]|uniref:hypothetical protein n=1 Tax=Oscillochloris sp. ZM17-4 TaxID=2866714 RepID=UPI001C72E2C5|nr:hypothetical protein [Oscillochloris sp. ZM17-4]MBX0329242.1 hypothetical protein [Oscillochloris sp. ZM17-4]